MSIKEDLIVQNWLADRHLCRTDLLFLCNQVLGYKDVSVRVHGPILEGLQKFPGAREFVRDYQGFQQAMGGKVLWEPITPLSDLPLNAGCRSRKTLLLYPRGHLKSTIATVAHSIQWIINYPNVRILITTATQDLGWDFVRQIKEHFQTNETFRFLFPELCPKAVDGKVPELGNQTGFNVPGRDNNNLKLGPGGKDATIRASTVGTAITGYHGDVQKSDDMVEKINSGSQTGIDSVIYHFGTMEPLLEDYIGRDGNAGGKGWVDLTGTPWDFSDLYQVIQNAENNLPEDRRTWTVIKRSAAPNWPEGPFLWPEKKGYAALKEVEDNPAAGPAHLAAQYLMNPIVAGNGLIDDINQVQWVPRDQVNKLVPKLSLFAALDLAGMDEGAKGSDNDYTCLTVGGFNRDGRVYIPYILHGRPTTEEVIEWIFMTFAKFPNLIKLKMEKEAHARVLGPFLKKEMARRGKYLPIQSEPRNNRQSKQDKIKGLRPYFVAGDIRFADDLPCRTSLITEIKGFPKFRHDDILDTLCDIFHEGRDINLAVMGREKSVYDEIELKPDGTKVNLPSIAADTMMKIFEENYGHEGKYNKFTGFIE